VDVDPYDIPNGYCEDKHKALESTINEGLGSITDHLHIMACHESPVDHEKPCVGWLANQLGPGNNLGLRMAVLCGHIDVDFKLVGEQHPTLEATLPKYPE